MATQDNQNIWFGVSMFLLGLVAGAILLFFSGVVTGKQGATAPTNKQAPQVSAEQRMTAIAKQLGLNASDFATCLKSGKYTEKITSQGAGGQATRIAGKDVGVSGTPGNIVYDLKSKRALFISGAQPYEVFKGIIDDMLKDPAKAKGDVINNVVPVDFATDHVRGDASAKIAVIEYSDFECPFCQRVHPTYQKLLQTYGNDVAWVYRHFPLPPEMHPNALPFAIGSECAAELGGKDAFWKFADAIFQ